MELQALNCFLRSVNRRRSSAIELNQSKMKKLMDFEEQSPSYEAIDFSHMYR